MRTRVQWLLPADAPIAFWRIESKSARVARLFKGGVVRRGHAVDGRGKNYHTRLAKNTKGERIRAVHVGLLEAATLSVSICRADAETVEIAEALALPAPGLSPPEHTSVVHGATRPGAPPSALRGRPRSRELLPVRLLWQGSAPDLPHEHPDLLDRPLPIPEDGRKQRPVMKTVLPNPQSRVDPGDSRTIRERHDLVEDHLGTADLHEQRRQPVQIGTRRGCTRIGLVGAREHRARPMLDELGGEEVVLLVSDERSSACGEVDPRRNEDGARR